MRPHHLPHRLTCAAGCVSALLAAGATAAPLWPEGDLDGAVTLVAQHGPDYLGARTSGLSVRPGFYVRWGRLALSSGGGWASPRQDDDLRGLGLELKHTRSLRVNLGLRMDSGRNESAAPALAGMGDVKRTLRVRLGANWQFAPQWELRAGWTIDAFGRGGGNLGELKVQHDWPVAARLHLTTGVSLSLAGDRYLQTYYGVTPAQSARTGYPVFEPRMSLRDVSLFTTLRADMGEDWVGQIGAGATRVLGDAAHSPLSQRLDGWSVSAGVGWRF